MAVAEAESLHLYNTQLARFPPGRPVSRKTWGSEGKTRPSAEGKVKREMEKVEEEWWGQGMAGFER